VSNDGGSPLHAAASQGNNESVDILLNASALLSVKDARGLTPLDRAREKGHVLTLALLEEAMKHSSLGGDSHVIDEL